MLLRNLTSWDTMITWLAKNGHSEDAIEIFRRFKKVGLKPDNQMFLGVLTACSVVRDIRKGLLHLESMIKTYNLAPSMDNLHCNNKISSSFLGNQSSRRWPQDWKWYIF
ncbi:unnamed protein product [Lactuca virosa]|uniref:Pentatricopeptide repeat-containing protein n=1 Tax=Lactuca virosa TaxID=75947 RepID=A0AAU9LDM4_9ASTR|nr:unnamed protein product [Lactuca virosa]